MIARRHSIGILGSALLTLVGCDAVQQTGPILYRESERAATELATKPKLRELIRTTLLTTFGPDLQHIKVPDKSGLRDGGMYLADRMRVGEQVEPVTERDPISGKSAPVPGGYALYRNHCLHCHGVAGAGDGPTAAFLFPHPRDYRPGVFKFTSTNPVNAKPTRADLRKTLLYGLHGTSMPGFEATMTASQIEQVIDYVIFLSMRGETERVLIEEAATAGDADDPTVLDAELVQGLIDRTATSWVEAETQIVNPTARRVDPTAESVRRGRDLYLGINTSGPKLQCTTCHGVGGQGNGSAFIDRGIFDDVVFRQYSFDEATARTFRTEREQKNHSSPISTKLDPAGVAPFLTENPTILNILRKDHNLLGNDSTDVQFAYLVKNDMSKVVDAARKLLPDLDDPEFRTFLVAKFNLWKDGSLDYWNNPLRPANLIDGVYKGGRRPIDLYWRIAKGINGAKMPAHTGILTDDQMWDIINFILALPDQPELLQEVSPTTHETKTAAVVPRNESGKR